MMFENLALRRPALQSSTSPWSVDQSRAVDAAVATLDNAQFFHTGGERFPWWQIDLGVETLVSRMEIRNRADMTEKLTRFTVLGSLDGAAWLPLRVARVAGADTYAFDFEPPRLAQYLRVRLDGMGPLHFRQCLAFGRAGDNAEDRAAYVEAARAPEARRGEVITADGFGLFLDEIYAPEINHSLRRNTYEKRERDLVCRFLEPEDRVLEAGTAIGLMAMTAAAVVGPKSVATFEANPDMVADAEANFARNGLPIVARYGALIARARFKPGERLPFHIAPAFWASRLGGAEGAARTVETPTFCLEEEVARARANVLICDIEGGEVDLLTHADLSAFRLIVLETHTWSVGAAPTDAMMRKLILDGFSIDVDASGQGVFALRR